MYEKLSKCEFWLRRVIFIGHVISRGGMIMDPSKIDYMLQWDAPKPVTENRSFLGLADYYRKSIEGFSKLALPWKILFCAHDISLCHATTYN